MGKEGGGGDASRASRFRHLGALGGTGKLALVGCCGSPLSPLLSSLLWVEGAGLRLHGVGMAGLCAPLLLVSLAWVAFEVVGAAFRGGRIILIRCVST
jgi:hypothetical protein